MNKSLDWIDEYLADLENDRMRRSLRVRQSPHVGGMVQIDGRQLVDFGSNDYLSLSADTRLVDAVRHSAGQLGWGAGASPLISGRGVLHQQLEHKLAEFKQTESALLFPTGFAANVGVITSLVGKDDFVFSDQNNHASIIDGCRLSAAETIIYDHLNVDDLREKLRRVGPSGRRLIVTDTVFSMDGDIAALPEICDVAEEFGAMLMVDEAHATGIFGARGSGICEWQNVEDRVPVRVGTLSKALGSLGGFVAGSKSLIDLIVNRARTYIFSTSQPEAICAAAIESLKMVSENSQRRIELLAKAEFLRERLSQLGWNIGQTSSMIIPVMIGPAETAVSLYQKLFDRDLFVPVIRPPAVAANQSLLRISLSAGHTQRQIDQLLEFFAAGPGNLITK